MTCELQTKQITTVGIDPAFDADHRVAFKADPTPLKLGDTVFIVDHYWPGRVSRITGDTYEVQYPTLLDGLNTSLYRSRELRHAPNWAIPSATRISRLSAEHASLKTYFDRT